MKYIISILCFVFAVGSIYAQSEERALEDLMGQEDEINVELYPNPAIEYLNIRLSGEVDEVRFEMHNIIGNKIKIEPEQIESNHYRINVKDLAPGYYLVAIKESDGRYNKIYRFLKR